MRIGSWLFRTWKTGISSLTSRIAFAVILVLGWGNPTSRAQEVEAEEKVQQAVPAAQVVPAIRAVPAANMFRALPVAPARQVRPTSPYDLSKLVLAKYDLVNEEPHIVFLVDQFRTEEQERNVTSFRVEQRTRTVPVRQANGEMREVEQTYVVQVPFTERKLVPVKIPAGKKPSGIPMSKLKLYRLDGTAVTAEVAQEALSQTRPIFLFRGKMELQVEPASSLIQQAMHADCLLAVTDQLD